MTHELYLDIETIPTTDEAVAERVYGDISAPANYKDPEKIAAYIEGAKADKLRRTSLDGTWGEVIVVGFAVGSAAPDAVVRDLDEPEDDYLSRVWAAIKKPLGQESMPFIIGHNVVFDMRFLHQRSVVNRVKPSITLPVNMAPYQLAYFDTMQEWAGYRNTISLGNLCFALGVDHDDSFEGSMVAGAWEAGNVGAIVDHCLGDVSAVRQVYKRIIGAE